MIRLDEWLQYSRQIRCGNTHSRVDDSYFHKIVFNPSHRKPDFCPLGG